MIDSAPKQSIVRSATPEDGGCRVTFEICEHVWQFAVHPGQTAHCSACMDEFLTGIRQGKGAELMTPREFLIAPHPKLAEVQRDAQHVPDAHSSGSTESDQKSTGSESGGCGDWQHATHPVVTKLATQCEFSL